MFKVNLIESNRLGSNRESLCGCVCLCFCVCVSKKKCTHRGQRERREPVDAELRPCLPFVLSFVGFFAVFLLSFPSHPSFLFALFSLSFRSFHPLFTLFLPLFFFALF